MQKYLEKIFLKNLWLTELLGWKLDSKEFQKLVGLPDSYFRDLSLSLERDGRLEHVDKRIVITEKGRKSFKVVLAAGTFDIIHLGHVLTLEQARRLGDALVVVVARDMNVKKIKGKLPVLPENERLGLVSELKPVDVAVLGDLDNKYSIIKLVKPDIIAIGPTQPVSTDEIKEFLKKNKIESQIVKLEARKETSPKSTSEILRQIISRYIAGEFRNII